MFKVICALPGVSGKVESHDTVLREMRDSTKRVLATAASRQFSEALAVVSTGFQ